MNAVTLSDGRTGIRTLVQVETREPSAPSSLGSEAASPLLDFIASTDTLDRYQEIIEPAGWRLESYRRNPVFQNAHNYGDILFTIGKALITEVRSGNSPHLYQRVQFATEVNPIARIAYGLYRGGFLNAVSVGFIPIRWEDGGGERGASEGGALERGVTPRRRYLEQELLEVSAVAIPANPDALALGLKAGAVHKSDLRETAELLRSLVGTVSASETGAGASLSDDSKAVSPLRSATALHMGAGLPPASANNVELLTFARELRRIVRRA